MNPWEQMQMSGGQPNLQGLPEDKQENMLDELLHNYVLMPQMNKQREQMKQQLLIQQYMNPQPQEG